MKYCPNCRTQYTDDTLKFCLQDGTPLAEVPDSTLKTADYGEVETVVSSRPTAPVSTNFQTPSSHYGQTQNTAANLAPPKKSRTGMAVAVTIIVMLMLTGGALLGAYLYTKNKQAETAKNANAPVNTVNQNANKAANNANAKTPTPSPKTNTNANTAIGVNPSPNTLSPADAAVVKREVAETIDGWNSAAQAHNFDAYMEKYADTVNYYTKKSVSAAAVRADKQKAFSKYETIDFTISNLVVTPDASGHHATAVFDKEWTFENDESTSTGKVKSELQLENLDNEWRITSEKDLKLYYKE